MPKRFWICCEVFLPRCSTALWAGAPSRSLAGTITGIAAFGCGGGWRLDGAAARGRGASSEAASSAASAASASS
eukprot:143587-Prymnesium_polylepis.1